MKQVLLILTGLFLFSINTFALERVDAKRVEEVQQSSRQVMPFALDQTLQTFTKTVHGGVQHVVVKSGGDAKQIKLIQDYLLKLSNEFRKGNFSETERMHGADMPGLVQLKMAQTDDIKYEYKALPDGAQIHFSTEYPQYVQALHEWFDAQMSDHGNDVLPGHSGHHATPAE